MGFRAVDHSVTVIAFEKHGKKYAMTCAWAMMVDYDKLVCLIGSQSVTGKNISKNDFIGVSALNKKQKDIAERLGDVHSDEADKLKDLEVEYNDTAIVIKRASRQMICRVIDILHLPGIEEDNLVYLQIVESEEYNENFLHMSEM